MRNYMERYQYIKNNTDFRIATSEILVRYKKMQGFMLNDMTTGRNTFPEDVREIYLLKLDLWFYFLLTLEREWLSDRFEVVNKGKVEEIIDLSNTVADKYREIIDTNDKDFCSTTKKIWLEVHETLYDYLLVQFEATEGMDMCDAYSYIGSNLVEVMQATLYELHEINILNDRYFSKHKEDNECVLIFTDICPKYRETLGKCLIGKRYKVYKKYFDINTMIVRDYSTVGLTSKCLDTLDEYGTVDYRKSLSGGK